MREKEISEGLGDMAHAAEQDHEVQMARAELYKLAKYAIKLHYLLKDVSETEGLEGWVQSKITKSSEMISSVYHHMDYKEGGDTDVDGMAADALDALGDMKESKDTHCSDDCCGADVKAEDCTCSGNCSGCNCNSVNETLSPEGSNAMNTLRKIVANKQNMPVKFDDGSMKVDLFSASAITQVYDAVKPETREKIDKLLKTKAGMMKVQAFSMKAFESEEFQGKQLKEAKKKMVKDPKTGKMVPDYAADGKGKNDLTKGKKSKVPPQFQKESLKDRLAAKLAESACCSDCGNPSYKSVSEEKKKGSHGKVCWKGYRRGKGNSCHKVKGDG